jgi:hypothetical protein
MYYSHFIYRVCQNLNVKLRCQKVNLQACGPYVWHRSRLRMSSLQCVNLISEPYTTGSRHTNTEALTLWGMRWRSWLRHCATSRKVAGSIHDRVIGFLQWQSFRPHYGPGVDSDSNRNKCCWSWSGWPTRPRPTALLSPSSDGKPEAATAVVVAPDDVYKDARNMLSCI